MAYNMENVDDRVRAQIHDVATRIYQSLIECGKGMPKLDQTTTTEYGLLVELELLAAQFCWITEYTGFSTEERPVMSPLEVGEVVKGVEQELLMSVLMSHAQIVVIDPDGQPPDNVADFFGGKITELPPADESTAE